MAVSVRRTDDPDMAGLGTNLREARERLGPTQERVAQRSGVHATEVSRIEAGMAIPRTAAGQAVARIKIFSISPSSGSSAGSHAKGGEK